MNVLMDQRSSSSAMTKTMSWPIYAQYEDTPHLEAAPAQPREVLRFSMEQHDLRQGDLAKELGNV